jgi:rfaE bifunctional protein kinase chain/domain
MKKSTTDIERLRKIINSFSGVTITVLGDLVADEFIFGEISRVSREAPVLILRHRERSVVPGGGANAICNLADLGVRVFPVGLIGEDEPGNLLLSSFRERGLSLEGLIKSKRYKTVTKTRILAGTIHGSRQQVVRIDREPAAEPDSRLNADIVQFAKKCVAKSDALLISDYGYGSATPGIVNAILDGKKAKRVPVVLDSRHRMLEYSGITAATPNEPEVVDALGVRIGQDWERLCSAGEKIMASMKLESLVITRGRDGMVAFSRDAKPLNIPISGSDEVADVTGAGDTVIAAFTAALAAGARTQDAAHLANFAGGIVVMKRGTATASREELLRALDGGLPRAPSR